jgi:hypothetical protein
MNSNSICVQPSREARANAGLKESARLAGDHSPDPLERHFSPETLAQIWGFDVSTVRRMFQDEPGVLKYGKSARRDGKRDYVTLRIPESVVQRVYREKVQRP